MAKIGLVTGSFDPLTNGHLDIIARASKLFDTLYVGILYNRNKSGLFTIAERKQMLEEAVEPYSNVSVVTAHDSLAAHARDEIGINEMTVAKPIQAALSSALSFSVGAVIPLLAVLFAPAHYLANSIVIVSIFALLGLGALASYTAGSPVWKGALRVLFWGCFAMLITSAIGSLFDVNVA